MKRLVVGILAHVDSGKTTLSEGMLYCSGDIRKLGRVDHKNAFLDTYSLEKERGITIFSKQAVIHRDEMEISLLDTPGHVDFSAETERTLQVLDYAILVINGSDGVQNHTRTLWKMLERYNVPVFLFINKMDISGVDKESLVTEIKHKLSDSCCDFSVSDRDENFYEEIAFHDEECMTKFLENMSVSDELIANCICERKIFPCYFGSALKLDGVEKFLNELDRYMIMKPQKENFSAKVFKISEDEQGNRLTHLKITGGSLKVKEQLSHDGKWQQKVNHIRIYSGNKFSSVDEVFQGAVCAVTGLSETYSGEGLGDESDSPATMLEPVLTYKAEYESTVSAQEALAVFRKLENEDPKLHVIWNEQLKEIHVQVMGEMQTEILKCILKERFMMNVNFVHGNIAYKETILNCVEGVGHYEPLRHYSEVHLLLEPLPRGSGMVFETDCREDTLDKNWQRLVMTHLHEKLHIGVLTGSPVTDIKITLVSGKAHLKHTEGGDFRQATYRAVRQGLRQAESILLEPWYEYILEVPGEYIGRAMSDLDRMGCSFSPPETYDDTAVISGRGPVFVLRDYQSEVTVYTKGRGTLSCTVCGYEKCHNEQEVIEEIGYNCDSDVENSCDSVFCSHGAGFVVKWDQVFEYMHIPLLKTEAEKKEEAEKSVSVPVRTQYHGSVEQDKELMAIFERTYGKINQDKKRNAFKSKSEREKSAVTFKGKPLPSGPQYLLVDGYNIIFAWEELEKISRTNLDLARSMLINTLCNYQGIYQCEVILVFDAYRVKGGEGLVQKVDNIHVVYTKEAETADMYIEKVSHDLSREHRVRVATSDRLEQIIILGNGAFRISASELYEEVKIAEKRIQEFIRENAQKPSGSTLASESLKNKK